MCQIDIRGTKCDFPGIPLSTLQGYGPEPTTHLIMWKIPDMGLSLYLRMHLNMLATIEAIGRLFQFDIEGGIRAALFDNTAPTTRYLHDLDNYTRIICGASYWMGCPWRIARHDMADHELSVIWDMDKAMLETYRDRIANNTMRGKSQEFRRLIELSLHTEEDKAEIIDRLRVTEGRHEGTIEARDALK